jgi:carbonic anhydrase/acetyltransferase-like protein (isoleucine patch superfamily)
VRFEHQGVSPTIDASAVVAPTAVISGDVRIGADSQVLHGAIITAEGGPIVIGEHVIVMENAVIRSSAADPVTIGDHCLIGPQSSISGAVIAAEVFVATGVRIFNGAHIGRGSEVRINSVVHLRTRLPENSTVPIGWVAVGDPAQFFSPEQHDDIWAVQRELDFPGYVFGLDRDTPDLMVQLTERYTAHLARHEDDRPVE